MVSALLGEIIYAKHPLLINNPIFAPKFFPFMVPTLFSMSILSKAPARETPGIVRFSWYLVLSMLVLLKHPNVSQACACEALDLLYVLTLSLTGDPGKSYIISYHIILPNI